MRYMCIENSDGLIVAWFSLNPNFLPLYLETLQLLNCDTVLLFNSNSAKISCLLLHSEKDIEKEYQTLLAHRQQYPDIPAIIITEASSKRRAQFILEGIDDVVNKDICPTELLARIKRLHTSYTADRYHKKIGPFSINYLRREIHYLSTPIPLMPREYLLLDYLLRHSPTPISRMQLLSHLWNCNHEPGTNSVEVHIWRLRRKLEIYVPQHLQIKTIRGEGYTITTEPEYFTASPSLINA